jgi:methionine-rich copper-binding protein CopC
MMARPLTGLAITALVGAAVLFAATPAWAHSEIVDSTPEAGETLTALPEAFSVTASETLLDLDGQGVFALQIRDAAGDYYGTGCVEVVDATMSAEPVLGASGDYTMIWQVVSADGHPVSGEIPFTWEAPADFEPAAGSSAVPRCGGDLTGDETDVEASPTGAELAPGIGIGVAVAGAAAVVIVAATRRKRAT